MNMDKIKKYSEFYGESLIIYYHFPKKLAEKSYSTFNLRFSMVWAAAVPIKTKYFGTDQSTSSSPLKPKQKK